LAVRGGLFESAALELIFWILVLTALGIVAVYLIRKFRAETVQQEPPSIEMLAKFRELRSRGEISNAEFRTIETSLAAPVQDELKDNGQKG
jgi:uncharacterized membrane protein